MNKVRAARVATVIVGAGALVLGMQGSAWAAEKIPVSGGYGQWQADPSGSVPGDSIRACDTAADGWGSE